MESPDQPREPWIGPGISYRRHYHQALLSLTAQEKITPHGALVLEIIPEHFFADPAPLAALAERYCLVCHDVGLSIATVGSNEARRQRLQQLKTLVALARPVLFSDHLAMTTSPAGLDCRHLAPARYTMEALEHAADNIRRCQDTLQHYPLHAVQQLHLAEGTYQQAWWVDSHSTPVADASFALLQALPSCTAVKTIVVERDHQYPPLTVLLSEAQHAARLWHQRRHGERA